MTGQLRFPILLTGIADNILCYMPYYREQNYGLR